MAVYNIWKHLMPEVLFTHLKIFKQQFYHDAQFSLQLATIFVLKDYRKVNYDKETYNNLIISCKVHPKLMISCMSKKFDTKKLLSQWTFKISEFDLWVVF